MRAKWRIIGSENKLDEFELFKALLQICIMQKQQQTNFRSSTGFDTFNSFSEIRSTLNIIQMKFQVFISLSKQSPFFGLQICASHTAKFQNFGEHFNIFRINMKCISSTVHIAKVHGLMNVS